MSVKVMQACNIPDDVVYRIKNISTVFLILDTPTIKPTPNCLLTLAMPIAKVTHLFSLCFLLLLRILSVYGRTLIILLLLDEFETVV